MLSLLLACAAPDGAPDPAACDARALAPGEVRARRIPCSDELIAGGEGRTGDWVIENAMARYVVRGPYAALTLLDEPGGTLVDAAFPGGTDVLLEYVPDGDRSTIVAENDGDEARLVLPGVTYRLGADDGALAIDGAGTGTLQGVPTAVRTGATLGDDAGTFFGVDGAAAGGGGRVAVAGVTRAAVEPEALWPDGARLRESTDADFVRVLGATGELWRAPVTDGVADLWLPAGASTRGEREGCEYEGLIASGCGWLRLRVGDGDGNDLRATVTDGLGGAYALPPGGGLVPVGPRARVVGVWAGPRYGAATLALPGGDADRVVTLGQQVTADDAVLAALAVEVAPDADVTLAPEDAAAALAAEGVAFAVLAADDEIPTASADPHDAIVVTAGSRAGVAFSWPWSPNGRKPAHGAAPWARLGALDLLAVIEGGASLARRTVVDVEWIDRARAEAPPSAWDPRPDGVWLASLEDVDAYLGLLDDWIDVAPLASRTWIDVGADRNLAAFERGIVEGRTSAGTGPRVTLARAADHIAVRVEAPRWMEVRTVALHWSGGVVARPVQGAGEWKFDEPEGATWLVATVEGEHARPGLPEPAWAVSGPLWVRRLPADGP